MDKNRDGNPVNFDSGQATFREFQRGCLHTTTPTNRAARRPRHRQGTKGKSRGLYGHPGFFELHELHISLGTAIV